MTTEEKSALCKKLSDIFYEYKVPYIFAVVTDEKNLQGSTSFNVTNKKMFFGLAAGLFENAAEDFGVTLQAVILDFFKFVCEVDDRQKK